MKRIALLLALVFSLRAQPQQSLLLGVGGAATVAATPAFVSFNGMPSTETNAVGAKTDGTCAANAYCAQLTYKTIGGETILVPYTYKSTSTAARAPTITDDKPGGSSTYTCIAEGNDANGSARTFAGICYLINASAGILNITTTFPVATNTQAAVGLGVCINCTAIDVSAVNGTQTAATTLSSGAMTTTANNDLVCELAIGTTTRTNVTDWTAGSGFTMYLADRRDASAFQCQVQTSAGSITPSVTGQSNAYVAAGISFKAGTQGTAPTGFYISHVYTYNSAGGGSGNLVVQFPILTTGSTIVQQTSGGGTTPRSVTAVSDGTNGSYTTCGAANSNTAGGQTTTTFYRANATSGLVDVTLTTAGTGDTGPTMFYELAGAATVQNCVRAVGNTSGVGTMPLTTVTNYHPGWNPSLNLSVGNFATNTAIAISSPSGAIFGCNTYGLEPIDGPEPVCQNGMVGYFPSTTNTPQTWTWTGSLPSGAVNAWAAEVDGFQGSGATALPLVLQTQNAQSVLSSVTMAATFSNATASGTVLIAGMGGGGTRTITKVCTDGTTCAAGHTFTQASGAAALTGTQESDIWYCIGCTSGITTVTATYSGSAGTFNKEIKILEVQGLSTFDIGGHVSTGTGSGTCNGVTNGCLSGSVTTTGANGFILAVVVVGGSVNVAPSPGNAYIDGSPNIWSTTTDANASLISTSGAAHQAQFADGGSADSFCMSLAALK